LACLHLDPSPAQTVVGVMLAHKPDCADPMEADHVIGEQPNMAAGNF
jgi:hypothetical protein